MRARTIYDYVSYSLARHVVEIKMQGSKGFTDLHRAAEFFYVQLLNLIFDVHLRNADIDMPNCASFDAIDAAEKLLVQISSDDSREKIERSLTRKALEDYKGHSFWFLFLVGEKKAYRSKPFSNPYGLSFDCEKDIYIPADLAHRVLELSPARRNDVYELVREEFGEEPSIARVPSNLTSVVKLLAGQAERALLPIEVNPFEIERKITFNDLTDVRRLINKYAPYYRKIDDVYSDFDVSGSNVSAAVFGYIGNVYLRYDRMFENKGDLFYKIIDEMRECVMRSDNCTGLTFEEIDDAVSAIAVDAFVRCKIFKNPSGYDYRDSSLKDGEHASS